MDRARRTLILPNRPRAGLIEASERDYRVVPADDAISQATEQAFRELAGIGVVLAPAAEIAARVTAPA